MRKYAEYFGYIGFGIALIAMLSSLALSEVFDLTPCVLCWYQRIAMYPLVAVIGVGIIRKDEKNWPVTALILAAVGWLIAFYHSLLQWGVIPSSLAPCVAGESCVTKQIEFFGFITIPFMALVAFTVIILMSYGYLKRSK